MYIYIYIYMYMSGEALPHPLPTYTTPTGRPCNGWVPRRRPTRGGYTRVYIYIYTCTYTYINIHVYNKHNNAIRIYFIRTLPTQVTTASGPYSRTSSFYRNCCTKLLLILFLCILPPQASAAMGGFLFSHFICLPLPQVPGSC